MITANIYTICIVILISSTLRTVSTYSTLIGFVVKQSHLSFDELIYTENVYPILRRKVYTNSILFCFVGKYQVSATPFKKVKRTRVLFTCIIYRLFNCPPKSYKTVLIFLVCNKIQVKCILDFNINGHANRFCAQDCQLVDSTHSAHVI